MDSMLTFLFRSGIFYNSVGLHKMARYSFGIASSQGHVPSIRELGILMIHGRGGDVDIYEGSRLLHRAEEAGDIDASLVLDSYLEF